MHRPARSSTFPPNLQASYVCRECMIQRHRRFVSDYSTSPTYSRPILKKARSRRNELPVRGQRGEAIRMSQPVNLLELNTRWQGCGSGDPPELVNGDDIHNESPEPLSKPLVSSDRQAEPVVDKNLNNKRSRQRNKMQVGWMAGYGLSKAQQRSLLRKHLRKSSIPKARTERLYQRTQDEPFVRIGGKKGKPDNEEIGTEKLRLDNGISTELRDPEKTSYEVFNSQPKLHTLNSDGRWHNHTTPHKWSDLVRFADSPLGSPSREAVRSHDRSQHIAEYLTFYPKPSLETVQYNKAGNKLGQALQAILQPVEKNKLLTQENTSNTSMRYSTFSTAGRWDKPKYRLCIIMPPFNRKSFTKNLGSRLYTTSTYSTNELQNSQGPTEMFDIVPPNQEKLDIRRRLRVWQEEYRQSGLSLAAQYGLEDMGEPGSVQNLITRPQGDDRLVDFSPVEDHDQSNLAKYSIDRDGVPETSDYDTFLQPGDLVELPFPKENLLAIFCCYVEDQAQYFTMDGKWVHRDRRNVSFRVPGFLTSSALLPLLPHLPQTIVPYEDLDKLQLMGLSVPRSVSAPFVESMLSFHRAADETYRKFASKLDNAYKIMAQEPGSEYVTTLEIATKVLEVPDPSEISSANLWAVHRALLQDDIGFYLEGRRATSSLFSIRLKQDVEVLLRVRLWLRQYQEIIIAEKTAGKSHEIVEKMADNPISKFAEKARTVITGSRKYRAVTQLGSIGPSSTKIAPTSPFGGLIEHVCSVPFTTEEQVVIRFLEMWSVSYSIDLRSALNSLGPMILHAIGMYPEFALGKSTAFVLLKELGVFQPWANTKVLEPRLGLPHTNPRGEALRRKRQNFIREFQLTDKMKHLRRDWGELEVFCIDSVDANEIDDGISLESVPHDTSQNWVHVHIANPTAFMSPDDPLAKFAAHMTESLFFPEVKYPMIASKIVQNHFSLAKDRPTLTFSARLDAAGEILETMITPGTIRNVCSFDPQTVHRTLVEEDEIPKTTITIPDTKSVASSEVIREQPNELQKATLRKLNDISEARRRKHEAEGGSSSSLLSSAEVTVQFRLRRDGWPSGIVYPNYKHARRVEGDPVISLTSVNPKHAEDMLCRWTRSSEQLVANMMILAGEVAATWCKQRQIPILYKGCQTNPYLPSREDFKKRFMDPEIARNGYVGLGTMREYMQLLGNSITSSKPIRHPLIGTDCYTKVTSPLRRYGDMIAHWQIEAAILHESSTGSSLIGSVCNSYLPFSPAQVESMIPRICEKEKIFREAMSKGLRQWVLQALFRAHYFKEATLPDKFLLLVHYQHSTGRDGQVTKGRIMELSIEARITENETSKEKGGFRIGDWWECAIREIDLYGIYLEVTPLTLVKRDEGG